MRITKTMRPVDENGPDPTAYSGSVYDSSLESDTSTLVAGGNSPAALRRERQNFSSFRFSRLAVRISAAAVVLIVITGVASLILTSGHGNKSNKDSSQPSANYSVSQLPTSGLPSSQQLQVGEADKLAINGQLQVNNTLVLSPTSQPTAAVAGQIYYDKTTQAPYYYNGSSFVSLAPTATPQHVTSIGGAAGLLALGDGLEVDGNTIAISSSLLQSVAAVGNGTKVTSLQGLTGNVSLVAGSGITISGTTITNGGVVGLTSGSAAVTISHDAAGNYSLSYSGVAGLSSSSSAVSVSHDTAGNYSIGYNGVATLTAGSPNLSVTNDGSGNYTVTDTTNTGSSAGQVALGPNSAQPDSTGQTSIHVNKTGVGNFLDFASSGASTFVVNQAGQIVTGTINYSQVQGAPTSTVTGINGVSGAITLGTGLALSGSSLSNSGVTSLAGTANQVIVSAGTGAVTISLPQDISTASTPSFAGANLSGNLTATTATFNGNLTVSGASSLTTGSGTVTLGSLGAGLVQSNSSGVLSSGAADRNNSADFSGTLSTANGGTGATSFSSGGLVYASNTGLQSTAAGTAGQLLVINSSALPNLVSLSGDGSLASSGSLTVSKLQGNPLSISVPTNGQVLQYNGTSFVNSLITNNNLQTGAYSNVNGVGALTSGSISTGFGAIATANNITTTTALQGNTLNAVGSGAALELNGLDINSAGTLNNVAYLNQINNFTASSNKFTGNLSIQGAGGLTLGIPGTTGSAITFANNANSRLTIFQALTPSGTGNATVQIPSVPGGGTDQICLLTLGNCVGSGGAVITTAGTQNYVTKYNNASATQISNSQLFDNGSFVGVNTTTNNGQLSVVASGTQSSFYLQGPTSGTNAVTVIKSGGSSSDLLDLDSSTGTVLAKIDNSGNLSAINGSFSGTLNASGNATFSANLTQSGAGSFSTASGAVSLNGNTTVSGSNSFTTGSGAVTVGSLGTGLVQSNAGGTLSSSSIDRNSGTYFINGLNVANGGTGTTSFSANGILYGNGTGGLQATAAANNSVLISGPTGTPALSQTLPIAVQSNITNVGSLSVGSIASGFGAISTANNIATTAVVQGNVVNATGVGSALEIGGANINTAGTLNNVAYLNQVNTFSAASNTFGGNLSIQGSGGLSVGVPGTTTGAVSLANTTSSRVVIIQALNPTGTGNATVQLPSIAGGTTDQICLVSLGNCAGSGTSVTANGGAAGYVPVFTTSQNITSSILYQSGSSLGINTITPGAFALNVQGGNVNFSGNATIGGNITVTGTSTLAGNTSITGSSTLTVGSGATSLGGSLAVTGNSSFSGTANFSGNINQTGSTTFSTGSGAVSLNGNTTLGNGDSFSQNGAGSFSTGSGAVSLNGAVSVTGTNTLSVGTGAVNFGGSLGVGGLTTLTGGATVSGAVAINTTGTADTAIGNSTGNFSVTSAGFNVTTSGAVSGISTLSASGAISAASSSNTINGLVINGGALSSVASIATTGGYSQTGSSTNTFSGATTFGASGTALTVNNNASINGTASIGTLSVGSGGINDSGTLTVSSTSPSSIAGQLNLTASGTGLNVSNNATVGGSLAVTSAAGLTLGSTTNNGLLSFDNGSNTATLQIAGPSSGSGTTTYSVPGITAGTSDTICLHNLGNCGASASTVTTSSSGTVNTLAKFTGSNTIANSGISDDGTTVTVSEDLSAANISTATIQSSGALTITPGGNATIGATNHILALQGNSSSTFSGSNSGFTTSLGFVTPTANNTINLPNASGTICLQNSSSCGFATSGSGVTSVNAATGALTINNTSTAGTVITINNASTTQKGIAQFNSSDFSASSGTIDTIQGITTTSAVQFGSLNLGSGDLTLSSTASVNTNNLTSLGNGITFDAGANAITFKTSSGTNSFVFPTYGGLGQVICTSGISCTSGGGSAVILEPSAVQTATANRTAIFINKSSGTGNLLELQAGGTDALVIDNSGNTTISNATTIASLTVPGTITANSIVPSSALTVGAFGQSFSLQGTSASTISATAGSYKTNVGFATGSGASAPTGNVTYDFQNDNTVAAGTYNICTTAGNCAGVGGGVTTSGGTPNALAKFTSSGNIANSIVTDNGSTVTIGGNLAVGTSTSGQISLGVAGSYSGSLVFNNSTNSNTITLSQAGAPAANTIVKLPNASGTVAVSATGPISLDPLTGQISCASCLTSGGGGGAAGVSSVDGLSGSLTLNNSSGIGSSITIDDASTTQKGIAQFNTTNFTASSGVINTVQDIASSASPTFTNLSLQGSSGLLIGSSSNVGQLAFKDGTADGYTAAFSPVTLTANRTLTIPNTSGTLAVGASGNLSESAAGIVSITGAPNFATSVTTPALLSSGSLNITSGGQLSIGTTSQQLTLLGNGSTTLASTSGSFTTTVGFTSPTANRTISFPDATGTICLQNSSSCGFALSGSSVTSVNGLSGALTVANASGSGTTITINTASTSQLGLAQFNGTNFSVASGIVNTIQDIATSASPTFAGLTLGASGLTDNGPATFNGNTSVSGTNTFTVGTGAVSLGGTFGVAGLTTLSAGLTVAGTTSITGATTINTTGNAATSIGNAGSTFKVNSTGFNVTTGGAVSGVTTLSASGAISAATSSNTINGLVINSGALSNVTGYSQTSGNFAQAGSGSFDTGSGTVSLNGNTSVTGSNNFTVGSGTTNLGGALNVTGTGTITGGLNVGSSSQFQVDTSGNVTSGTINGQTISSSANFTGTVTVQGSSLNVGVNGTTAGKLNLATTGSSGVSLSSPAQSNSVAFTFPVDTNSTDEICVKTLANCTASGSTVILNQTSLQTSANFDIQSAATTSTTAVIKQLSGQTANLLQFQDSSGTVLSGVDKNGYIYTNNGVFYSKAGPLIFNAANSSETDFESYGGTLLQLLNSGSTLNTPFAINHANISPGYLPTLAINDVSGQTTNSLEVSDLNGNKVDTIDQYGNLFVQPHSNTTNTFQVQNSSGTSILSVSTTGSSVAVTGTLSVSSALTANSTFTNNYTTGTNGSASSLNPTNSNTSNTANTVNGLTISPIGTANSSATNTNNAVNFSNISAATGNNFSGLQFGTGYNGGILNYGANNVISSTGLISNYAINGTYSNLTGTGALASGSIASGFGTISTANNISTTAAVQGGTVTASGALAGNSLSVNSGAFAVSSAGAITASTGIATSGGYVQSGTGANTLTGPTTLSYNGTGLAVSYNATVGGTLAVTGAETLGTAGSSAGSLVFNNASNSHTVTLQGLANASANLTLSIPAETSSATTTDTVCLQTLGNCVGTGGAVSTTAGTQNYITKYNNAAATQISNSELFDNGSFVGVNTTTNNGQFSVVTNGTQTGLFIQGPASGSSPAAVVQSGGGSGDLLDLSNSSATVLAKIDANGNLTAVGGNFSGNIAQTGATSFSTGTAAVSLNGNTTVGGTKSFTTGSGTVTLGSLGTGLVQSTSSGVLSSGAVDRNSSSYFSNTLSTANGGTGAASFTSNGVLYGNAGGALQSTVAGTSGQVLLANGSGVPTFTSLSGDLTVSSTGVTTIGNGVVTGAKIASATVANSNLVNSSLTISNGTNITGGGLVSLGGSLTVGVINNPTFSGLLTGQAGLAVTGAAVNLNASSNFVTNINTGTSTGAVNIGNSSNTTTIGGALTANGAATFTGNVAVQGATGLTIGVAGSTNGTLNLTNSGNSQLSTLQTAAPTGTGNVTYVLPTLVGGTSDTICVLNAANCATTGASGTGFIRNQYSTVQAGNFFVQNAGLTNTATAVIEQSASQTGDLLQFQNSGSTVVARVDASGNLTANSVLSNTFDTPAAGSLAVGNTNATTLNIGTTANARSINIATGAAAQTTIIGSTNTSSPLTLQSGTSSIALTNTGTTVAGVFNANSHANFSGGITATTSSGTGSSYNIISNETNTNTTTSATTVGAYRTNLTGTINSNGSLNTLNGLSLSAVAPVTGNVFNGITAGTGYDSILSYNGTTLINGTGSFYTPSLDSTSATTTLAVGNTNATTLNIGTTANARSINIATGAAAQTTIIGSTNTSSPLTLQSGTSSIALTNTGTNITGALQAASLDTNSASSLVLGGTNATSIALNNANIITNQPTINLFNVTPTTVNAFGAATAINLGASTGTTTINTPALQLGATGSSVFVGFVGNTTGVTGFHSVSSTAASATTGAISLRSGNATGTTANSGAVVISTGSATAAAGNINIDTGAGASGTPTINIGSNTATPGTITASTNTRQVNIGNTSGTTGVSIQGGSGAVNINNTTSSTGTISIGNTSAGALSLQTGSTIGITSTNFNVTTAGALSVGAGISSVTGYSVNGTSGSNFSCSAGNSIGGTVVSGGIITGGTCGAVAPASGSTFYVQNGTTQQASSNFNISGTGVANALQAISLDTNVAGVLTIGGTNASSIALNNANITSNQATVNLFNVTPTTINAFGNASTINIGSTAIARIINLGTGNAAETVNIGSGAAGSNIYLHAGGTTALALSPTGSSFSGTLSVTGATTLGSTTAAGKLLFTDGTANGYTATLQQAALSHSTTINIPYTTGVANNYTDTVCLLSLQNCVGQGSSVGTGTITGAQNYVTKYNNATGTQIVSSQLYDDGTFVGINTLSNLGQLSVVSSGTPTGLYVQGPTSGTNAVATFKNNGGTGDLLDLFSGGSIKSYITNAGLLYIQSASSAGQVLAPTFDTNTTALNIGTSTAAQTITIGSGSTTNLALTTGGTVAISGNTTHNGNISFISTNGGSGRTISVAAPTTANTAGDNLTISAAGGNGASQKGGNLYLQGGSNTNSAADGGVIITNGSTTGSATAFSVQDAYGNIGLNVNTNVSAYITNSGFDTGTTGWTASDGSTALTLSPLSNAYDGQHAAQITTSGGSQSPSSGIYYQFTTKPAAGTYTLSFFLAKNNGTSPNVQAGYNQATGTFSQVNNTNCTLNKTGASTSFTQYFCTFTTATPLNSVYIQQGDSSARTFLVDDITLSSGSSPAVQPFDYMELGTIDSPVHIATNTQSTDAFDIQGGSTNGIGVCTTNCSTLRVDNFNGNVNIGYIAGTLPSTLDQLDVNGIIGATVGLSAPSLTSTSGSLAIGNTTAANTINIGVSSNGIQAINIANGSSTSLQTVTIGSTANANNSVTLQGGNVSEGINSTSGTITFQGINATAYDTSAGAGTDLMSAGETFATATNWSTSGSGPGATGASATHTSGSTTAIGLNPPVNAVVGTTYTVSFSVKSRSNGTVTMSFGGFSGSAYSNNGTQTNTSFVATTTAPLTFTPNSAFNGTVYNISIKPSATTLPVLTVLSTTGTAVLEIRGGGAGNNNSFVGLQAGLNNSSGTSNSAFGATALLNNTTGNYNTANGTGALLFNTTGSYNTATGFDSMASFLATTGSNNSAYGSQSGLSLTGSSNTAIGYYTLSGQTGSYDTALGAFAGQNDGDGFTTSLAIQNATAIGAYAQAQSSNNLILGSIGTSGTTNVGIGTTQALNVLSVEAIDYTAGTITQSGNTITGTGTTFTAAMTGDQLTIPTATGYTPETVTYVNPTTLTTGAVSQTIASTNYRLHKPGLQVTSAGNVCVAITSCTRTLGVNGTIGATGVVNGSSFSNTSGDDVDENITTDGTAAAYDVVMADPNNTEQVTQATAQSASSIVGVIGDGTAGLIFKSAHYNSSVGMDDATPANVKPLALSGRVLVHVTNENGAIKPGDHLTISSTTAGYATKAVGPGQSVGIALGSFDDATGTVLILINVGYYAGPTQSDYIQNGGSATLNNLTVNGALDAANINIGGLATVGSLRVTGSASIGGDLTIGGGLTVAGPTLVADITINGHIITAGNTPTVSLMDAAGSAGASVAVSGNDTSGTITVTVGQASAAASGSTPAITGPAIGDLLKLTFNKQYGKTPRVIITGNDANSAKLLVFPDAANAGSFNLSISGQPTATTTYSFNYFSVE